MLHSGSLSLILTTTFLLCFPAVPVTNGSEKQESPRPTSYVSHLLLLVYLWPCFVYILEYQVLVNK